MNVTTECTAIAIVGIAGRFPGAPSVGAFWRMLCEGREGIRFFRDEELADSRTPPEIIRRPNYVPAKGVLDGAEEFDAELFGLHPRDALVIDPQQRLLLETAWEALEDASCDPHRYDGLIGVFAGVSMNSWIYELLSNDELRRTTSAYQLMISNDKDYAATRISYELNLRGPSVGIQTACSTSLVAVERACQSLVGNECDLALAGAASLAYPRKCGYLHEEGMILSPDGHCRAFDARARGTVPGEGVAVVALKRLSDALADRDSIYAVIRGWATNNDGSNKIGFTAPSIGGQAAVIAMAQAFAGISPDAVEYIETHGTATPLGDPIEVAALTEVFRAKTSRRQFCRLGAVKSNIGHLDTVAGLAGLIKTALALKFGQIPPSLHFEQPNPEIDFDQSPFRVATELVPWPRRNQPRFAGVSSFGIGGTNCHLVLEESPCDAREPSEPGKLLLRRRRPHLLLLTGASRRSVDAMANRLAQHLRGAVDVSFRDIAYSFQVGRQRLPHRRMLVANDREEALAALEIREPHGLIEAHWESGRPPVTFLFPGQGVQPIGMVRELYERYGDYRNTVDECLEILGRVSRHDFRTLLLAMPKPAASHRLQDTAIAQPAVFVATYALARLLMMWDLHPDSLVGHSLGEIVAACLSGVMRLPDALRIVTRRGELMQSAEPGAMLAVALADPEVDSLLGHGVVLAARNAPRLSVLSGSLAAIADLERTLEARHVATWRLRTSHAFHSPSMDKILDEFCRFVGEHQLCPPELRFLSNVTGMWITNEQSVSPAYWASQLRSTVRFRESIYQLAADLPRVFLEVGPGQSLQPLLRETLEHQAGAIAISTSTSKPDGMPADAALLDAVGRLCLAGVEFDWEAVNRDDPPRRLQLPTYPFQRQRFSVPRTQSATAPAPSSEVSKRNLEDWFYAPSWVRTERVEPTQPWRSPQNWLVFLDSLGIGDTLMPRIRATGGRVIGVRVGAEFQKLGPDEYSIPPGLFGGYSRLFKEALSPDSPLDRIVHLWTLTGSLDSVPTIGSHDSERWLPLGFYSLLFLAQTLGRQPSVTAVRIDVISDGVQDVTGQELLCPGKAMLRAPVLVAPQEYPHLRCRHVDVECGAGSEQRSWLVEQLLAEIWSPLDEPEVALRGRRRWCRTYQRVSVPRLEANAISDGSSAGQANRRKISPEGAWIVLGGLGQLGLVAAGWLAMTRRPPLVLVGRSVFPAREDWDTWLAEHDADDPTSCRIMGLRQLVDAGCDVQVHAADAAKLDELRSVARFACERYGRIGGVVHSAGVVESRIIHYTSPTDCSRQFQAKVRGIQSLAALTDEFHIPLCVVNSSLSSVLGGLGFCAYTASNLYLDTFLQRQNRLGKTKWIGINWDGWLFPDVAEMMGNDPALRLTLTPEQGLDCLHRITTAQIPQMIVSTGSLDERRRLWVLKQDVAESLQQGKGAEVTGTLRHPRPSNLAAPYVAPGSDVERAIVEVWEQLLGIDGIGVHDDYLALGGHSLLAGQIIGRLRDKLKVPLSIRSLFEFPTISKLATHIAAVKLTLGFDVAKQGSRTVEVEF